MTEASEIRIGSSMLDDSIDPNGEDAGCSEEFSDVLRPVRNWPNGDDGFDVGVIDKRVQQGLFGDVDLQRVDRYEVERLIGSGGMGAVYRAHDPKLERSVALKRVNGDKVVDDPRVQDQMLREAQRAAKVSDPHVVNIYDYVIEGGVLYVVMEYVDGKVLNDWLDSKKRSWREIVEMFVQAGKGLSAVHAQGMAHLDFKPSNVLVDKSGRARVVDFGLARMAAELGGTTSGGIAGTPRYMAPEQREGIGIGYASDQFSFCVALYEALFGRRPFRGETAGDLAEVSHKSMMKAIMPSDRRGAPRALVRVLARGMRKEVTDRHRSMGDLVEELQSLLDRRRLWVQAGAAVLFAGVAFLVGHLALDVGDVCDSTGELWDGEQWEGHRASLEARYPDESGPIAAALSAHADEWEAARRDSCVQTKVTGEQTEWTMALRTACLDRQRVSRTAMVGALTTGRGPSAAEALSMVMALDPASDCGAEQVQEQASKARPFAASTDASTRPEHRATRDELIRRLEKARVDLQASNDERSYSEAEEIAHGAAKLGFTYLEAEALWIQGSSGIQRPVDAEQRERARVALERSLGLAIASGSDRLAAEICLRLAEVTPAWQPKRTRRLWLDMAGSFAAGLPEPGTLSGRIALARAERALVGGQADEARALFQGAVLGSLWSFSRGDRSMTWYAVNRMGSAYFLSGDLSTANSIWNGLYEMARGIDPNHEIVASTSHNLSLVAAARGELEEALRFSVRAESEYEFAYDGRSPSMHSLRNHTEFRIDHARVLRTLGRHEDAGELLGITLAELKPLAFSKFGIRAQVLDEMIEVRVERGQPSVDLARQFEDLASSYYGEEHAETQRARMMWAVSCLQPVERDLECASLQASRALSGMPKDGGSLLEAQILFVNAKVAHAAGNRGKRETFARDSMDVLSRIPGADQFLTMVKDEARKWALDDERGLNGQ